MHTPSFHSRLSSSSIAGPVSCLAPTAAQGQITGQLGALDEGAKAVMNRSERHSRLAPDRSIIGGPHSSRCHPAGELRNFDRIWRALPPEPGPLGTVRSRCFRLTDPPIGFLLLVSSSSVPRSRPGQGGVRSWAVGYRLGAHLVGARDDHRPLR
jgi:hypothetical protein